MGTHCQARRPRASQSRAHLWTSGWQGKWTRQCTCGPPPSCTAGRCSAPASSPPAGWSAGGGSSDQMVDQCWVTSAEWSVLGYQQGDVTVVWSVVQWSAGGAAILIAGDTPVKGFQNVIMFSQKDKIVFRNTFLVSGAEISAKLKWRSW